MTYILTCYKIWDHSLDTQIILICFFIKYKNEWKEHSFQDKKINKINFYKNKKLFKIDDIDINEILASKKNHMVKKLI